METEVWEKLPLELLEKIQLRFPAREIVKCRLVSKEWDALSRNPTFVAAHRDFHRNCCFETMFVLSCDATPRCSFNPLPSFQVKSSYQLWLLDTSQRFFKLPTPKGIPERLPCRYLRAASGGLLLILAYDTEFRECAYYVWNPCIQECYMIGSPDLWGVLLDALVVDNVTREFTVVCCGRRTNTESSVSTMVYNSQRGWSKVSCTFPCVKCNRIRGPLSCRETNTCSWLIEDAEQLGKDRYLATFYSVEKMWKFEEVGKDVDWLPQQGPNDYKKVSCGPCRNNFAAVNSNGVVCFLSGNQRISIKDGSDCSWGRVEKPKSKNPFSNLLPFHLSL